MKVSLRGKLFFIVVMALVMSLVFLVTAYADLDDSGDWDVDTSGSNAYIKVYHGTGAELVIPGIVTVSGTPYNVLGINNGVFTGNNEITSATIPAGVIYLGEEVFCECENLASVSLPSTLNTIGIGAFAYCNSLTSIELPASLSEIDNYLFDGCENLANVTINNGPTKIGENTFYGCKTLTSITIPASVTEIADYAFLESGLTSITIPATVTTLGNSSFEGCSSLISATISNGITELSDNIFYNCTNLTNVSLSNTLTIINESAFAYCDKLTNIVLPNGLLDIEEYAFSQCEGITSIILPNTLMSLGFESFGGTKITTIDIPASVTVMESPFYGCDLLTAINVSPENTVMKSIDGVVFSKDGQELYMYPPGKAGPYTIPDGVVTVSDYAINACNKLTALIMPDSVLSIGEDSFSICQKLVSVILSNNLEVIDHYAFHGCTRLKTITIPGSLTTMGQSAFSYCEGLKTVVVEEGVTEIARSAFSGCEKLNRVTLPETLTAIGNESFSECKILKSINLPDTIETIGDYAFAETGLISFKIPDSLVEIEEGVFYSCTKLKEINVPEGITSLDTYAFADCKKLKKVSLPDSLNDIEESVFSGCTVLTEITIPEGVTEIKSNTFQYCYKLSKVNLPNSLDSIGYCVFGDCTALKSFTVPHYVTSIDHYAFENCTNLKMILIPEATTSIRSTTFDNHSSDLAIHGDYDSYARTYAESNDITFVLDAAAYLKTTLNMTSPEEIQSGDNVTFEPVIIGKPDGSTLRYTLKYSTNGKTFKDAPGHIGEVWTDGITLTWETPVSKKDLNYTFYMDVTIDELYGYDRSDKESAIVYWLMPLKNVAITDVPNNTIVDGGLELTAVATEDDGSISEDAKYQFYSRLDNTKPKWVKVGKSTSQSSAIFKPKVEGSYTFKVEVTEELRKGADRVDETSSSVQIYINAKPIVAIDIEEVVANDGDTIYGARKGLDLVAYSTVATSDDQTAYNFYYQYSVDNIKWSTKWVAINKVPLIGDDGETINEILKPKKDGYYKFKVQGEAMDRITKFDQEDITIRAAHLVLEPQVELVSTVSISVVPPDPYGSELTAYGLRSNPVTLEGNAFTAASQDISDTAEFKFYYQYSKDGATWPSETKWKAVSKTFGPKFQDFTPRVDGYYRFKVEGRTKGSSQTAGLPSDVSGSDYQLFLNAEKQVERVEFLSPPSGSMVGVYATGIDLEVKAFDEVAGGSDITADSHFKYYYKYSADNVNWPTKWSLMTKKFSPSTYNYMPKKDGFYKFMAVGKRQDYLVTKGLAFAETSSAVEVTLIPEDIDDIAILSPVSSTTQYGAKEGITIEASVDRGGSIVNDEVEFAFYYQMEGSTKIVAMHKRYIKDNEFTFYPKKDGNYKFIVKAKSIGASNILTADTGGTFVSVELLPQPIDSVTVTASDTASNTSGTATLTVGTAGGDGSTPIEYKVFYNVMDVWYLYHDYKTISGDTIIFNAPQNEDYTFVVQARTEGREGYDAWDDDGPVGISGVITVLSLGKAMIPDAINEIVEALDDNAVPVETDPVEDVVPAPEPSESPEPTPEPSEEPQESVEPIVEAEQVDTYAWAVEKALDGLNTEKVEVMMVDIDGIVEAIDLNSSPLIIKLVDLSYALATGYTLNEQGGLETLTVLTYEGESILENALDIEEAWYYALVVAEEAPVPSEEPMAEPMPSEEPFEELIEEPLAS